MKDLIKRLAPYAAIEAARRIAYFGFSETCQACGARLRLLKPQGYGHPVLEQLQVVGGMRRGADVCPVCHANDRDRLVIHYLEREVLAKRSGSLRIAHIAPEKPITKFLLKQPDIDYHPGDFEPHRYYHLKNVEMCDLTAAPYKDGSIDLLICNHVMEHIPEDGRAMAEVRRVLKPGGRAILQTPLAMRLDETDEGDGTEDVPERIRRFGQSDHVRLYAQEDYPRRLTTAGLRVERWRAFDADAEAATKLRLNPLEELHVCWRDA